MKLLPPSTTDSKYEKRFILLKEKYEGSTFEVSYTIFGIKIDCVIKYNEICMSDDGVLTIFLNNGSDIIVGGKEVSNKIAATVLYFGYESFVYRCGFCIYKCTNGKNQLLRNWIDIIPIYPVLSPRGYTFTS